MYDVYYGFLVDTSAASTRTCMKVSGGRSIVVPDVVLTAMSDNLLVLSSSFMSNLVTYIRDSSQEHEAELIKFGRNSFICNPIPTKVEWDML